MIMQLVMSQHARLMHAALDREFAVGEAILKQHIRCVVHGIIQSQGLSLTVSVCGVSSRTLLQVTLHKHAHCLQSTMATSA